MKFESHLFFYISQRDSLEECHYYSSPLRQRDGAESAASAPLTEHMLIAINYSLNPLEYFETQELIITLNLLYRIIPHKVSTWMSLPLEIKTNFDISEVWQRLKDINNEHTFTWNDCCIEFIGGWYKLFKTSSNSLPFVEMYLKAKHY